MVLRLVCGQPLGRDVVPLVMRTRITSSEVLLIDRSWSAAELPEFCIIVSRDCHDGDDDDGEPSLGISRISRGVLSCPSFIQESSF